MANQDISRFLLQPAKHYASVHLQQGRVLVDSDSNEHAAIVAEDLRSTLLDIVCSRGTPNDGMLVTSPVVADVTLPDTTNYDTYNFSIGAGSFYLGGLRFATEAGEAFLTQSDWLQIDALASNMPAEVLVGGGDRIDLIYMLAWEQPVTGVEDSELLEPALGGRDTSVRIKRMRRFDVMTGVSSTTCDVAFGELTTSLTRGDFDSDSGELVSKARLTVGFAVDPVEKDLCAEPTASGYVEAQNQAIRVELRPSDKLVWGFDNASALYRVQVDSGDGTTLTFLTEPPDLEAMPKKDQLVELIPWGALLPNQEKVAEPFGVMARVATTYDPSTRELIIDTAVSSDWTDWLAAHTAYHNTNDPASEREYLYLRVWDRGDDTTSDPEILYTKNVALDLGDTGLSVTVTADGMPGDFWIIAARPSTPDVVTPWDLGDAAAPVAPHGPRRFYTPLATINWDDNGVSVTPTVLDCRAKLTPLCASSGCCTVTVGDGKTSHGTVSTLQDAIDVVPDGGKICILPGTHEGTAVVADRSDIVIEGCGVTSVLANPVPSSGSTDFEAFYDAVLRIEDSSNITVRDVGIQAFSAVGVEVVQDDGVCKDIRLEGLTTHATGTFAPPVFDLPAPGINVIGAREVDIVGCRVISADVLGFSFGVVLGGEHLRMHDCIVEAPPGEIAVSGSGWGVNIRSASRDVEIVGCQIEGGWGHGVALGHGDYFSTSAGSVSQKQVWDSNPNAGSGPGVDDDGTPNDCDCDPSRPPRAPLHDPPAGQIFLPAGPVEDVRIYDNEIRGCGLSGISTAVFFPHNHDYQGLGAEAARFIVVTDIDIARNLIEDNVLLEFPASIFEEYDIGIGGVVLAASVNAWIHDNEIRNNGASLLTMPMCGVGLVAAMNAVIEDNQIRDTGRRAPAGRMYLPGLRGGIAIGEATAVRTQSNGSGGEMPTFEVGVAGVTLPPPVKDWTGAAEGSAVVVRGNEVSQPLGRALWVRRAFAAVTVTGNSLESYGSPVFDGPANVDLGWRYETTMPVDETGALRKPAAGACVEINNFGLAVEIEWSATGYPEVEMTDPGASEILGGQVLFSANTTRLEWTWPGGWATSVLLSSFDSSTMTSNSCVADMGSTYSTVSPDPAYDFLATMGTSTQGQSLLLCHAYVGGRGGSLMSGNRISEGEFDALFSGVAATALAAYTSPFVQDVEGACSTSNIGSHWTVGAQAQAESFVIANNLTTNKPADSNYDDPADFDISVDPGGGAGLLVEIVVGPL